MSEFQDHVELRRKKPANNLSFQQFSSPEIADPWEYICQMHNNTNLGGGTVHEASDASSENDSGSAHGSTLFYSNNSGNMSIDMPEHPPSYYELYHEQAAPVVKQAAPVVKMEKLLAAEGGEGTQPANTDGMNEYLDDYMRQNRLVEGVGAPLSAQPKQSPQHTPQQLVNHRVGHSERVRHYDLIPDERLVQVDQTNARQDAFQRFLNCRRTTQHTQTYNDSSFQGRGKNSVATQVSRTSLDHDIGYFQGHREPNSSYRHPGGSNGGGGGDDGGDDGGAVCHFNHVPAERKPKKPALYNGKTSWLDYLVHFEMISEINGWTFQEMALELATSLRDNALAVLSDIDRRDQKNYACLVSALTTRFEPSNYAEVYRAELKSRVRDKNENLSVLAQDIKRLIRKVYADVPKSTRDELAKECFIDALNDEDMEWAVHQNKPVNIDDALQFAMEFESFRKSRKQRTTGRSMRMTGVVPDEENKFIGEQNTNNVNFRGRGRGRGRGGAISRPRNCWICGSPNHFKADCDVYKSFSQWQVEQHKKPATNADSLNLN